MIEKVKAVLIERAKKNSTITYGAIMQQFELDYANEAHMAYFSDVLSEVSEAEHAAGRPLLSVMAKRQDGSWGPGFFNVSEKLGFGDAQKLKRGSFAKDMQEECFRYWSKESTTKKQAQPDFFTREELDFFREWQKLPYDKNNPEHRAAKNKLLNTVWKKTAYWSNEVRARLSDYEVFNWRMWSKRGWRETPEGKVQCALFKEYSWARVFKKGDRYKDIFFTVGYDAPPDQLVYKLDYYFESNAYLTPEQQTLCAQLRPEETKWQGFKVSEVEGWDDLINRTVKFIKQYEYVYDELLRKVWGEEPGSSNDSPALQETDPPESIDSNEAHEFYGREIDWDAKSREAQATGRMGEEMVLKWEAERLIAGGRADLAEQVKDVLDGEGYDILSFNLDGTEIHIEVKTTIGGIKTPFFITETERRFAHKNKETFCLFRLYNLDRLAGKAHYYKVSGDLSEFMSLEPIVYRVSKKHI